MSSILTVYHDDQFWTGIVEYVEDGKFSIVRIVFGAEPSDEKILQFAVNKWEKLIFFDDESTEMRKPAKTPSDAFARYQRPSSNQHWIPRHNRRSQISGKQWRGSLHMQEANAVQRRQKLASNTERWSVNRNTRDIKQCQHWPICNSTRYFNRSHACYLVLYYCIGLILYSHSLLACLI